MAALTGGFLYGRGLYCRGMRKLPFILFIVVLLVVVLFILFTNQTEAPTVPTPERPAEVTPPTLPSKDDLVTIESPAQGTKVTSPLTIIGKARGNWFFEGSFPITLVNWDGLIIAEGYATAQGEWMTSDYVPFVGTITFNRPDISVSDKGWLILKKDNPSDDPKLDNALEVEIRY